MKKFSVRSLVIAISLILISDKMTYPASAAAGDLDLTFGTGGKVITAVGNSNESANGVAIQSDGKIVAVGGASSGSENDFAVVRYNINGSLDTSFSGDGKVTTVIGDGNDAAWSVALQSDGKIVAAGYSHNGTNEDFALVRYQIDGSLDTSFGTGGKVTTQIGASNEQARSVVIQSDGKIIAAGWSSNGSHNDFAIARYNSDGTLDTTFSSDGKTTTAIGLTNDTAYSVAIQGDGKILLVGYSSNGTNNDFAIVRYNSDGNLDATFGTGGKVTTAIGSRSEVAFSVALQSNGKIVVAGAINNGSNDDVAVVRYNEDGSPDTSFGSNGIVTTGIGASHDWVTSLLIQDNGKIVGVGQSYNGSNYDFALVRYNADGSPDTSFGSNGKVTTAIGTLIDVANASKLQSDGKIVVVGYSQASNNDFAVLRYQSANSSVPGAPTLNSVSTGDRKITISFTAGADNGATITDYEYSLNGGSYISAGTTSSPFTITGLSGRTAYSVALKARNSSGLSAASSSLSAITTDATLDAYESAVEAARIAAAKQQKELLEILSLVPELGKISVNIGETSKVLAGNKCVKGKVIKYVYKGAKCPKGFVKRR
jgi:uncharacterized delta-60 repeat protein